METCGMSIIKYILFFFNLIFAISGIGIITAGVFVIVDIGGFNHFLEGRILAPPIVLIIVGVVIFLIAFLGCYGAISENYNMLMAFAIALLLIFIAEMAVGIAAAVFKNDFSEIMKKSMMESLNNNTETNMVAWNNVQSKLECCGVDKSTDWHTLAKTNPITPPLLPASCCKEMHIGENNPCSDYNMNHFTNGCFNALNDKVHDCASVLIGVGIGIAFVEVAGIILACCLAISIKNERVDK